MLQKVNNPGGLDEATLNSLITQATEAITQQQIIQVILHLATRLPTIWCHLVPLSDM